MRRDEVVNFWDEVLAAWALGDDVHSADLTRWQASYSGRGRGAVDLSCFPEPYIGPLAGGGSPKLVMLGLNPGVAVPDFQARGGIYTERLAATSYSRWAASGPYTDEAWESRFGRNKYQRDRLVFARRLRKDDAIAATDLLYIELYPFHSARVTATMRPPHDLITEYVFEPLADVDSPYVFAFGKPWERIAADLGLGPGRELDARWSAPGRSARVYPLLSGQELVVMSQPGYAGPPGERDVDVLRSLLP